MPELDTPQEGAVARGAPQHSTVLQHFRDTRKRLYTGVSKQHAVAKSKSSVVPQKWMHKHCAYSTKNCCLIYGQSHRRGSVENP